MTWRRRPHRWLRVLRARWMDWWTGTRECLGGPLDGERRRYWRGRRRVAITFVGGQFFSHVPSYAIGVYLLTKGPRGTRCYRWTQYRTERSDVPPTPLSFESGEE